LKPIPADTAQGGIAFSTGKNSKIRARKTDPCIDFKKDAEIVCQSVPHSNAFLRFCSTIPNFLRQFPDSKSNSPLGGIGLSGVFQGAKLLLEFQVSDYPSQFPLSCPQAAEISWPLLWRIIVV
jgi:hypothetical protein